MPRDLVKLYSFVAGTRSISVDEQIPFKSSDVRLIINETKHEIICSSMQKENITVSGNVITFASKFSTLDLHDEITIEIDFRLSEIVPVVPESPTTHKVIFIDPFDKISEQYVRNGYNAKPPTPIIYENLEFAEWNQSYENVTEDRVIGAVYNTVNNKSYAYISITKIMSCDVTLYFYKPDSSTLTIDWGDGTTSTFTNASSFNTGIHTYSAFGDYIITMWISSGSGTYQFGGGTTVTSFCRGNENILRKILIANNAIMWNYTFHNHKALNVCSINIHNKLLATSALALTILRTFVCSKSIEELGNSSLHEIRHLINISFSENTKTLRGFCIGGASALQELIMTNSITYTENNFCAYSNGLSKLQFSTSLTIIRGSEDLYALKEVFIREGITIYSGYFRNLRSVSKVIFPSTLTNLSGAFNSGNSCSAYVFLSPTLPTIGSSNFFYEITNFCKIYVKDDLVEIAKIATNWSIYANYIYPLSTYTP